MRSWNDFKKTMRTEDILFQQARTGDLEGAKQHQMTSERLEQRNPSGYSPLMLSAYNGQADFARLLLENGAEVESRDLAGNTVLMGAAFKGDLPMIHLLLEYGADAKATNLKGQSAVDFANLFGRVEVAKFLKSLNNGETEPSNIFSIINDVAKSWRTFLFTKRSI